MSAPHFLSQLPPFRPPKVPLRVGTDCSGLETPIQALRYLNVPYEHLWSCDRDRHVKASIMANYPPQQFHGDIFARDHRLLPKVDLYVAGFPCQTFSTCGKRAGFADQRGTVFWQCLEAIRYSQPQAFVLENVRGLLHHEKGHTFEVIRRELEALADYDVQWRVLDTKQFGVPHQRHRLYIVGLRKGAFGPFEWPDPVPLQQSLDDLLGPPVQTGPPLTARQLDILAQVCQKVDPTEPWCVNLNLSRVEYCRYNKGFCPCLTACGHTWWLTHQGRRLTIPELRRLQAVRDDFQQVVSDSQFRKQLGNAMSVNVLCFLLARVLDAML